MERRFEVISLEVIRYDPKRDKQTGMYPDEPVKRPVPEIMYQRTKGKVDYADIKVYG